MTKNKLSSSIIAATFVAFCMDVNAAALPNPDQLALAQAKAAYDAHAKPLFLEIAKYQVPDVEAAARVALNKLQEGEQTAESIKEIIRIFGNECDRVNIPHSAMWPNIFFAPDLSNYATLAPGEKTYTAAKFVLSCVQSLSSSVRFMAGQIGQPASGYQDVEQTKGNISSHLSNIINREYLEHSVLGHGHAAAAAGDPADEAQRVAAENQAKDAIRTLFFGPAPLGDE